MKFNRLLAGTVFAVIVCILAVGGVSAADYNYTGPANSSSSVYQADNQHTGQSNYTGPQTNTTKWIDTSSGSSVKIAIGSDGTIYTGGNSKPLRAFAPNGTEKWSYSPPHQNILGIAVGNNETIYLTITTGLVALYSNGTEKWFYNANSQDSCSFAAGAYPVISSDGTIYLGGYTTTQTGLLYAFDPNGNVKWGFTVPGGVTGAGIRGSVAIGHDGTVYVASGSPLTFNGTLYALDPAEFALNPTTATPKWNYTLPSGNLNGISPVVGVDGTIYLLSGTSSTGIVYAVNQNETLKWSYNIGTSTSLCGLAIASNGTIYVVSGTTLYAFNPADGTPTVIYSSFPSNAQQLVPVVGADGIIYVGGSSKMYAFEPNGTIKWTYDTTSSTQGPVVIAADGTLYFSTFASSTSRIFALQDLVGDFTANPSGLGVQFTDTSSNIPTSWSWDFGDGTTSTEQNPTHIYGHAGNYTVTLTVGLASGEISTVQKEVTVNQAPIIDPIVDRTVDENEQVSFVVSGSDPDGDPLIYGVTDLPQGATFNPSTGVFSWIPNFNQSGTYQITFTVFDGFSTVSETVTITVSNVNRGPTLNSIGNKTVDENKKLSFTVGGSDLDGDTLTYSATNLPVGATFNSATGVFSWIPNFNQSGTYQITFNVSDDSSSDSETIIITVNDGDNVAPTVKSVTPVKNAVVRAANAIKVTFSEVVKAGSLWVDLKNSSGTLIQVTKSISGNVLTITPKSALSSGKYSLALHTGAVADLAGNALALYSSSFTVDSVAPTVSKVDPANGVTKVATGKTIKITFNENIKKGSNFWVELKNSSGKVIKTINSVSGKVLTIDPTSNLVESLYTLVIHTGAVTDLAGNPVALKSTKFSVGTSPTVTKVDPTNGATKVAASKTIKVTFNEIIKKGGKFWVELKNSSGKAISFNYSINGKVLTVDPKSNLGESLYTLIIHTGAVTDLAGNPITLKTSKFSAGSSPMVSKIDPKGAATKVSRNKVIKVTFNENIKAGSKFWVELVDSKNKSVKITKSISGKVLTINHTTRLAANTKYKLILHTGAVTDKARNPTALKTYTFTTGNS